MFELLIHRWQVNNKKCVCMVFTVCCHLCLIFNLLSYSKFWFSEINHLSWCHIFALFMLTSSLNFPLRTLAQKQSYDTDAPEFWYKMYRAVHMGLFWSGIEVGSKSRMLSRSWHILSEAGQNVPPTDNSQAPIVTADVSPCPDRIEPVRLCRPRLPGGSWRRR